jgi:hypothetical protein
MVKGDPYKCFCECGLASTADVYEQETGRKVMAFVTVTKTGQHPISATKAQGDQCLMNIPATSREEAMGSVVKQGRRTTTIGLGAESGFRDRVKQAWDRYGLE